MNRLQNLLRSDWSLYLSRFAIVGANFASLLVVGYLMEPADFGTFVFFWALAQTLAAVSSLGGALYLLREYSARQESDAHGVRARFAVAIALLWPACVLVLLAGLWWGGKAYWQADSTTSDRIILVMMTAWVLNLVSHLVLPLRVYGMSNVSMALRDAGPQVILVISAIALVAIGDLTTNNLFLAFISVALCLVVLLAVSIWIGPARRQPPLFLAKGRTSKSKPYSYGFWGTTVLTTLSTQIDIIVGGLFVSSEALGIYQIIKRVANLISMPQIIANWAVVVPVGKAFAAGSIEEIQTHAKRGLKLSLMPALILLILATLAMSLVFRIYQIEVDATLWLVFTLLAFGSLSNIFFGANYAVATQCQLEVAAMLARIAGLVVSALVFVILARQGLIFVALGTATGIFMSNIVLTATVRARLNVDTSALSLIKTPG